MSAITVRNIPEAVHGKLKAIAEREGVSVEALAREAISDFAERRGGGGIDFSLVEKVRKDLGIDQDWDAWPAHFDDPAFSRHVLGLEEEDGAPYYEPPRGDKGRGKK